MAKIAGWICHAHPVELGGEPCGYLNIGLPRLHNGLECCQKCGCTRVASEARERRKINTPKMLDSP